MEDEGEGNFIVATIPKGNLLYFKGCELYTLLFPLVGGPIDDSSVYYGMRVISGVFTIVQKPWVSKQ
jgi:hypothetical protein